VVVVERGSSADTTAVVFFHFSLPSLPQTMECAVCGGQVRDYERIGTSYRGQRYRFCSDEHKSEFEHTPETFV
jgi:YHS domain-containing protein